MHAEQDYYFLMQKKQYKAAPLVAKQMAAILNKDEEWIQSEIDNFTQLAKNYLPVSYDDK